MPLLGKIVVIKRNGEDGTEFPLTAACMFGRKLDCDIRIQLPQVSKEHCRIELNENKELILTNLSSVNPTRINGEILHQSERLKDGDLITIIDRSFRFQYPPPPTPKKKRLSTPKKSEAAKILQDQQVRSTPAATEKKSERLSDTCLKDGSNLPTQDQSTGDAKTSTENTSSPFSELYNMVKRDLALKPQWKSATPTSKLPVNKEEPKVTPSGTENELPATPQSTKKRRRSSTAKFVNGSDVIELSDQVENHPAEVMASPAVQNASEKQKRRSQSLATPVSLKTPQTTPQKFTAQEVAQQIALESPSTKPTPKSPKSPRRSSTSQILAVMPKEQTAPKNTSEPSEIKEAQVKQASRTSPRANAGKRFQVQDVLNEIVSTTDSDHNVGGQTSSKKHKMNDLPVPAAKRKRVSFGGQLSPELFDKRLPPDSPLRRGATPGRRSLSFFQKPQSLLRRASTIGLKGFSLGETVPESPVKSESPKKLTKTPSPVKKSPTSKAKTPSPKTPKTPASSTRSASPKTLVASSRSTSPKTPVSSSRSASPKTPVTSSRSSSPKMLVSTSRLASPKTPKSSNLVSNSSLNTSASGASLLMTPTTHGRFSVSIISTPSPVSSLEKAVEESVPVVEEPQKCVTPKISVKRSSLRASNRKTPMSSLKNMVRSRRSGASLANLKVVSSWADIVKFGQVKSQMEGAKKTSTKQKAAKPTKVTKPKTPARRLVNHTSTGHADSPATIVVGKAYLRSTNLVGTAPKVVCNLALKKDMKMDEDLTGVADIFKTPANTRRKSAFKNNTECMETPFGEKAPTDEMSVMMTPEESGEMMVSPLSVASTAKCRGFHTDAVSRLLHDDKNGSLIEEMDTSNFPALDTSLSSSEVEPQETAKTPQRQPEPRECLTGVKRLMRTPKQKAEPIEDLRGKLLKTPKEPKNVQEESLEGLKELLKTPKQKATPVEDMAGLKELMTTPVVKDNSDVQRRSARTPKDKTLHEEDLTGVKQLMKVKGSPVKHLFGVERLLRTPKEKNELVEDLTGIQQMMTTPKQKVRPTKVHLTGVKQMMKSPKQKEQPAEVDLTGVKEMMETPKQKEQPAKVDLADGKETNTPRQNVHAEVDHTGFQKTPKQKSQPAEEYLTGIKHIMKTPKQKSQPLEDPVAVRRLLRTPKEKQQPVENDFEISQLMKTPTLSRAEVEDSLNLAVCAEEPASKSSSLTENESLEVEEISTDKPSDVTDADENPEGKENICPDEQMEVAACVQDILQVTVEDAETKTSQDVEEVTMDDAGHINKTQVESDSLESMVEETVFHDVESSQVCAAGKGKRDKAIAALVEDIPTQSPARKSTRAKTSKTEEKIVLEPRRGTKSEDVQTILNIKESNVSKPLTSLKATSKAKRGWKAEQESENKSISTVTEEPEVVPEIPVESNTRARRGRAANKNTQKIVQAEGPKPDSVADESKIQLSEAVVSECELEASAEIEVPVKSNTRSRGKVTKKFPNTEQAKDSKLTMLDSEIVPEPVDEPQPEETEAPLKGNTRSRRGQVAKKGISKAALVEAPEPTTTHEDPDKGSEAVILAVPENEAPVKTNTRSRRGKLAKTHIEDVAEAVPVNEDTLVSSETVAPVRTIARSRRGKANMKESLQVEQFEEITKTVSVVKADAKILEGEVEAQPVSAESEASEAEAPVSSNSRSRRGRTVQKEALKTDQVEKNVEATPVIEESDNNGSDSLMGKSGRGRRAKLASSKDQESLAPNVDEAHAECIAAITDTAEPVVEPVVKNVRGGRRANQTKAQVSEKSLEKVENVPEVISDKVECADAVVKPTRGKSTVTVVKEQEVPVKRGRRGTAAEVAPPVIKPSRGRRAAVKPELKEVKDDALAAVQEADQVTELVIETDPSSSEVDCHDNSSNKVVAAKRGRRRATKASNKDVSVDEAEEPAAMVTHTVPESKESVSKKAVNWNSDLVTWKNIEEFKSPAKEVPRVKGRKGKVTKKQDEPEKPKEENITPVKRGRTGASAVSKPSETIVPKRGQKRKETEVVTEAVVESVPKRRRGKAAADETTKEAEGIAQAKAEETKPASNEKPARGKRKATQETSAVQIQAEDPVEEVTTRRGTRAQKTEEAVVAAAPVRRTRRK